MIKNFKINTNNQSEFINQIGVVMQQEIIESIAKMVVNGNRLELPQKEQLSNYAQVKKVLTTAGGKYKKCGFEYNEPAQNILDRLLGGEQINDKKKFQFFATPAELAKEMIAIANVTPSCRVLEPSAGTGNIADSVREIAAECVVVELMDQNAVILKNKGYDVIAGDFLQLSRDEIGDFNKIISNPPFAKNQDIDHIRHMYSLLKPGGCLVSVASCSWTFGSQKKQQAFREWLDEIDANIQELPASTFAASGTSVRSTLVTIKKAA